MNTRACLELGNVWMQCVLRYFVSQLTTLHVLSKWYKLVLYCTTHSLPKWVKEFVLDVFHWRQWRCIHVPWIFFGNILRLLEMMWIFKWRNSMDDCSTGSWQFVRVHMHYVNDSWFKPSLTRTRSIACPPRLTWVVLCSVSWLPCKATTLA